MCSCIALTRRVIVSSGLNFCVVVTKCARTLGFSSRSVVVVEQRENFVFFNWSSSFKVNSIAVLLSSPSEQQLFPLSFPVSACKGYFIYCSSGQGDDNDVCKELIVLNKLKVGGGWWIELITRKAQLHLIFPNRTAENISQHLSLCCCCGTCAEPFCYIFVWGWLTYFVVVTRCPLLCNT